MSASPCRIVRFVVPGSLPDGLAVSFNPATNVCRIDSQLYLIHKAYPRRERAMWRARGDVTIKELENMR